MEKTLSGIAAFYSSEKFQLTASTKGFDSALRQLHGFQCGLVYCLHVVLLVRRACTWLLGFPGSRMHVWPVELLW